jgi:hypothetical protein
LPEAHGVGPSGQRERRGSRGERNTEARLASYNVCAVYYGAYVYAVAEPGFELSRVEQISSKNFFGKKSNVINKK